MQLKLIILLFLFFSPVSSIFAQSNSGWSPIGLTVSGGNIQNGVEAFYQLNKCKNENVVFIKFINHNNYEVIAEWNDAVFNNELKWVSNKMEDTKKSLTIGSNEVIFGDCIYTNQKLLVVKVNDFIKNIDDFNLFGINSFKVTSIIK